MFFKVACFTLNEKCGTHFGKLVIGKSKTKVVCEDGTQSFFTRKMHNHLLSKTKSHPQIFETVLQAKNKCHAKCLLFDFSMFSFNTF